jgi:hypothetical protein
MSDSNSTSGGGVGIFGILGIVFVVLKLVGVIAWPWLWVLAPFWAPLALLGVGLIVFAVLYAVAKLADKRTAKKVRTRGWEGGA